MMADRDITADGEWMRIVSHVQHAQILDVGPLTDADVMNIPSNHRVKPDAALFAHHHITDDNSGVIDEAGFGDGRGNALKGPNHRPHDRGIGLLLQVAR